MSAASFWDALVWTRFSKPRCERAIYQRVQRDKPRRIVELGVGDARRATQLIRLAQRVSDETIEYCGIDLFEASSSGVLTLKDAHNLLSKTGAKVRLVPGDVFSSLGRTANVLTDTDLLIIDASTTKEELAQANHFLPRMLHDGSSVARLVGQSGKMELRWLKASGFSQETRQAA